MKKHRFIRCIALILCLALLSGCSMIGKIVEKLKNGSDNRPANAEEIIGRIVDDVAAVHDSDSIRSITESTWEIEDPRDLLPLWEEASVRFTSLLVQGTITDLVENKEDLTFSYKVDGFPITYRISMRDDTISGTGSETPAALLRDTVTAMNPYLKDQNPLGETKLKALVLSWDKVPFERKDVKDIERAEDQNHWDLAQVYDDLLSQSKIASITVDRIDDFELSDLKPEILAPYDLIYINTHGVLMDGEPYLETSQLSRGERYELIKYCVFDQDTPSVKPGIRIIYDTRTSQQFQMYWGHVGVGGQYFYTYFPYDDLLNARWIHIGACSGMAGNNSIAKALHNAGADFITGYNDTQKTNSTYFNLREMIPDLLNMNSFSVALDDGQRAGKYQAYYKTKADLVCYPDDYDIKSEGLFCGIKVRVTADYYYPGDQGKNKLVLYEEDEGVYKKIREDSFVINGSEMVYIGLKEKHPYKLVLHSDNYREEEVRVYPRYSMDLKEIQLTYEGGNPGPLMIPTGQNAIHVFVTDDGEPPKILGGTSVKIYGKTKNSDEFKLILDEETAETGEVLEYIPDKYTMIKAVVSRSGYITQSFETDAFYDESYWQKTVRLKKGDNPPSSVPESSAQPESSSSEPDYDTAVNDFLSSLVESYGGVMPVGPTSVESDPSKGFKLIEGETQGLLFADVNDYDDDGVPEILTLRNDPQPGAHGGSTEYMTLEMYEYTDGFFEYADSFWFIAKNLSSTGSDHSFTVFRYGFSAGLTNLIGIEYYGQMNSETTALLILGYDDGRLDMLEGLSYGEWDGSDDMKSSFALAASSDDGFMAERDGDGFSYWQDITASGTPLDEDVLGDFEGFLMDMGLELKVLRSIYLDYNGTGGLARNAAYSGLTAGDCYSSLGSQIVQLGAITSSYGQNIQSLNRIDFTGLLSQFR